MNTAYTYYNTARYRGGSKGVLWHGGGRHPPPLGCTVSQGFKFNPISVGVCHFNVVKKTLSTRILEFDTVQMIPAFYLLLFLITIIFLICPQTFKVIVYRHYYFFI